MSAAPRIVERLLEALCPPSPFRDGVLGDLAEDFQRRRSDDGPLLARRWYYAQAFASAPHLVGHWARHVPFGAWIALTASGIVTMTTAVGLVLALQVAFVTWWGNAPDSMGMVHAAWRDAREAYPLMTFLMLQTEWLVGVLGGYLVGRRHRQAPVAAAGASAMITSILVMLALHSPLVLGLWFNLGRWTLCMLAGGVSYAFTQHRHTRYQIG